jgi:hypothetical protein
MGEQLVLFDLTPYTVALQAEVKEAEIESAPMLPTVECEQLELDLFSE